MNSKKTLSSILLLSAFMTACSGGGGGGGGTSSAVPKEFTQDFRSQAKAKPASQAAVDFIASHMKQESKLMPGSDVIFDMSGSKAGKNKDYLKLEESGRLLAERIWTNCEINPETRTQEGEYEAGSKFTSTTEKSVSGSACPIQMSESSSSNTSITAVDAKTGEVSFTGALASQQTMRVTDPKVTATSSMTASTIESKGTFAGDRLKFSSGVLTAGHSYTAAETKGSLEIVSNGRTENMQLSGKAEVVSDSSGTRMQVLATLETSRGPVTIFMLSVKDAAGNVIPNKAELIVNGQSYTEEEAKEKFGSRMQAFGN